jgi:hypothetical protein
MRFNQTIFLAFLSIIAVAFTWPAHLLSGEGPPASGAYPARSGASGSEGAGDAGENLRSLLIDLTEHNACERLKGRILPLSSGGTPPGSQSSAVGLLRIDTCRAVKIDPKHLRIDLSGPGWQWVARKKEKLGASFTLDENVRFTADISMQGTFDMSYDQKGHILTIWFVPTQPVEADLRVKGDVRIDRDSLWSAIVGTAGTILGQSPEAQARKSIREEGSQKFTSRLSRGFTVIVDLCTGEHHMRLGTFPAGELPKEPASPGEQIYLVKSRGTLHGRSLLMAGPYDARKPVAARLDVQEGGGVRASLVCEADARKIADAYANSQPLPGVASLAEADARQGKGASMKTRANPGCRVVLVMQPLDNEKAPVTFDYRVYHEGDKPKSLVKCDR